MVDKDLFDVESNTCADHECTGLLPKPVKSQAEKEAYEAIYPYEMKAVAQVDKHK